MSKQTKTTLVILLILIAGGLGFFGWKFFKKGIVQKTLEIKNTSLPGKLFGPQATTHAEKLAPEQVIYWTNKYRGDNGLAQLKENELLDKAAQEKVNDMFAKQYFDHVAPDGTTPSDLVKSVGYNFKTTGENLALGDFQDEKSLVDAWMASPGHRANILNKDFTEIGVATGLGNIESRNTWLAVQEFGKPAPVCATPDANLENDIKSKKQEYSNLETEYNSLIAEAKSLLDQGNAKIEQGNQIFSQTHDRSQAQPYWDEGKILQQQAQEKNSQAQQIQNQMNVLNQEINQDVNEYNSQANTYNACIKH